MISCYRSENSESGGGENCTTASTFEKPKSLKFELLFGEYKNKIPPIKYGNENIINAFDYIFLPGSIFGFGYESMGKDFEKFHHVFVLRACLAGEVGGIIPGISPGAEILFQTSSNVASINLRKILQKLEKNKINLSKLPARNYRRLNRLLDVKISTDFFVGELIDQAKEL
jgi:hypothetical protein